MEKVTIIIPAYNEEANLPKLIDGIQRLGFPKEIIVINDGSTDQTEKKAKAFASVRVISHPYNKGNGAAVKTGLLNAATEFIVVFDADGQYQPEDIPNLLTGLGQYDLVVGARTKESETKMNRNMANWIFSRLGSFITNFRIKDMTSGFRALKRSYALKFLNLYPDGFSFPTTSTMCFLMSGLNVLFIPVKCFKRAGGISKIRPLGDGMKFIVLIFRIVMFSPLKVFLPIGLLLFLSGVLWSIKTILLTSGFSSGGLLLLVTGLNLIFFGFMFDQIMALRKDIIQVR
ncbi:MAG: glycosyltransferase family 2 protein [Candidatus Omnitrophota bacterium]